MATRRTAAQKAATQALSAERTHKALEYAWELSPFIDQWEAEGYTDAQIVDLLNDGGAVVPSEYKLDRRDRIAPVPIKRWTLTQFLRLKAKIPVVRKKMAFTGKQRGDTNVKVWGDGAGLFAWPEEIGLDVRNHAPYLDDEPKRNTPEWQEWREWHLMEKAHGEAIDSAYRRGDRARVAALKEARHTERENWKERAARSRGLPWPPLPPDTSPTSELVSVPRERTFRHTTGNYAPYWYRPDEPPSEYVLKMRKLKRGSQRYRELAKLELDRWVGVHRERMRTDPEYAKAELQAEREFDLWQRGRGPRPLWYEEEERKPVAPSLALPSTFAKPFDPEECEDLDDWRDED